MTIPQSNKSKEDEEPEIVVVASSTGIPMTPPNCNKPPTDDDVEAPLPSAPPLLEQALPNNTNTKTPMTKTCRICDQDNLPETMMAPCRCTGSKQWTHPDCLDYQRLYETNDYFSQCRTCKFSYHLMTSDDTRQESIVKAQWRTTRFCLSVSGDFVLVTLLVQCILRWIMAMIWMADVNDTLVTALNGETCVSVDEQTEYQGDEIGNSFWCNHTWSIYYGCATLCLLVILGMIFCCWECGFCCTCCTKPMMRLPDTIPSPEQTNSRTGSRTTSKPENDHNPAFYQKLRAGRSYRQRCVHNVRTLGIDCWLSIATCCQRREEDESCCGNLLGCCLEVECSGHHHHRRDRSGGGGGGGDNDGGALLIVVLVVVVVVFAAVGFFVLLVLAVILFQRIIQRRYYRMHKKRLIKKFRVLDLSSYHYEQPTVSSNDGTIVLPNQPPLQDFDVTSLRRFGLYQ
jgi:hypothetical protein